MLVLRKDNMIKMVVWKWICLLDVERGMLTFYETLPTRVSTTQPPLITCYIYVGKIGLNTVHTPNGYVGIGTEMP